jgi:hypothetical protein
MSPQPIIATSSVFSGAIFPHFGIYHRDNKLTTKFRL